MRERLYVCTCIVHTGILYIVVIGLDDFFFFFIVEWTMNDAKRMYKILWPISKNINRFRYVLYGNGAKNMGLGNRKIWEWER